MLICNGCSEILRVIDSLQLTDRLKVVATPANWTVSVSWCVSFEWHHTSWNEDCSCLTGYLKLTIYCSILSLEQRWWSCPMWKMRNYPSCSRRALIRSACLLESHMCEPQLITEFIRGFHIYYTSVQWKGIYYMFFVGCCDKIQVWL